MSRSVKEIQKDIRKAEREIEQLQKEMTKSLHGELEGITYKLRGTENTTFTVEHVLGETAYGTQTAPAGYLVKTIKSDWRAI